MKPISNPPYPGPGSGLNFWASLGHRPNVTGLGHRLNVNGPKRGPHGPGLMAGRDRELQGHLRLWREKRVLLPLAHHLIESGQHLFEGKRVQEVGYQRRGDAAEEWNEKALCRCRPGLGCVHLTGCSYLASPPLGESVVCSLPLSLSLLSLV